VRNLLARVQQHIDYLLEKWLAALAHPVSLFG
jgi:hypothetical protein